MNITDLKALQSMVLLDITAISAKKEETLPSGIIIQKTMNDIVREEFNGKTKTGFVVKKGPNCRYVEVGDKVLLPTVNGCIKGRIEDGDNVYVWVDEVHIPAILEEGE